MPLIDNDLLSIQEARILLEHAEESQGVLEGLGGPLVCTFLHGLRERLLPQAGDIAKQACRESDYGNPEDERALIEWVLTELLDEVSGQLEVQQIYRDGWTHGVETGLPKGVVVSYLPDWLSVPTMLSQLVCAVKAKSPVIFSARVRTHATCEAVMNEVAEVAAACHYPIEALGFLHQWSEEGDAWLAEQPGVRMVIDSREYERVVTSELGGKDVYHASIGNNPVFVEETADLGACAEEVVAGKSFCYGTMPGAEQSVVVERAVDAAFRAELKARGCFFLRDDEAEVLASTLFKPDGTPYRELIGKSAFDMARRAGLVVPESTKVLVVEKPYVSEHSVFSKAKYGPVLSYYVEESWRGACEKCIELILNSGDGNALSIFSRDGEVVRQFVLKKPVGRVLVNVGTGMGATGCHSTLPKTLTVTGWDNACSSDMGVTYRDFIRRRQVGIGSSCADDSLLAGAGLMEPGGAHAPEPCASACEGRPARSEGAEPHAQPAPASSSNWFSSLLEDVQTY